LEFLDSEKEKQSEEVKRLENAIAEVTDIAQGLRTVNRESIAKLPEYESKADFLKHVSKKYMLPVPELAVKKKEWAAEKEFLNQYDTESGQLSEKKSEKAHLLKLAGEELTKQRMSAAQKLSELLAGELETLNMAGARVNFEITPDKVTKSGMDKAEMLIAVNAGEPLKPAGKTASGGELSRIMLAIKSIMAGDVPTMIFDEIDTGISGQAAQKVGYKLRKIAENKQVLCVTHLAVIAAAANGHFLIAKETKDGRTYTGVTSIDGEKRLGEISRIISGDESDTASLANAAELIKKMTA
jgi:DNA repair protein RecN (Recombination protein N)